MRGFYDDLFIAFTQSNLLRGNEEVLVAPEVERSIAAQSFLALSTTYYGLRHKEISITRRGLSRYGKALGVLNQALGSTAASRPFDVLEAVLIMALQEVRYASFPLVCLLIPMTSF